MSANGIQIPRNGYMVGGVEDAAFDKHTLATAKIDRFLVEAFEPRMFVPISEKEKQAFDFDAGAVLQQLLQTIRTQIGKSAEQGIDLFKRLMVRQLVEQFEDRSLGRRQRQRPVPLAPG